MENLHRAIITKKIELVKNNNTFNKDTDLLENGLEDMGRGKGKM